MKIAVFGGTFDPPHLGHVWIAHTVLSAPQYDIDALWFVPTYQQYYFGQAPNKIALPFETRLAMLNLLHIPKTAVLTIEKDHKLSGQTIELLAHLPKEHEYSFIIGSDQLLHFRKWKGWETLLARMEFLVYPRANHPIDELEKGMKRIDGDVPVTNISSTMVRERVRHGLPIGDLVPEAVNQYIKEHHLYEGRSSHKERKSI